MKKFLTLVLLLIVSVVIVACKPAVPTEDEVGVITWSGLNASVVVRGDTINLLAGVTATDSIDGDITSSIVVKDDGDFTTHLAGGYTVTYEVTNSTGVTDTKTKNFTVTVGHNVANGDFSMAQYGWTLDIPGGSATIAYGDDYAEVTITNAGTSWWGIQLKQENILFQSGTTYKATVVASSPQQRSMSFGYEDPNDGFRMLNPGFQAVTLETTPTTYVVYYTADENYSNIKAVLYLGHQLDQDEVSTNPHVVRIYSINIEVVTKNQTITFDGLDMVNLISGSAPFDLMEGVSASSGTISVLGELPTSVKVASTYFVTYVVISNDGSVAFATRQFRMTLPKDYPYQAINGNFTQGFTGWTQDVIQTQGTGAAIFTNNGDGTVSVNVTNASSAAWHIQLQQANSDFVAGESYVVRLRIKATEARKIVVEIIQPGVWENIAEPVTLDITTDWQEFEIHFVSEFNRTGAKLGLLLGNVDGLQPNNVTFTVDTFQVYKYSPFNSEFNGVYAPWVLDNINATVNAENQLVVVFEEGQLGDWPWNHQLYQSSGSELVEGHTYLVEVRLKSNVARMIRAWIEDVNRGYAGIATGANTEVMLEADTWTVISYTVTITADTKTTNAKFVIMFGGNFGNGELLGLAHTVTVDYFRVTDITNQN
jgi:hypothetical protein